MSPGPSSYQQQGTCLFTEPPDNHCVRVWSGIKPLSHAATMTLSSSQPDSNLTNAPFPSRRTPRLESAVHPHQSHHRHSIFRRQLKTIFRDHTISTHWHCSGPSVNCTWQHILCYCIVLQPMHSAIYSLPLRSIRQFVWYVNVGVLSKRLNAFEVIMTHHAINVENDAVVCDMTPSH